MTSFGITLRGMNQATLASALDNCGADSCYFVSPELPDHQ